MVDIGTVLPNTVVQRMSRLRAVVSGFGSFFVVTLLAACVIIPYKTGSETLHDLTDIPDPDGVRLSVGPRHFLDAMAKATLAQDKRLQRVDGQMFIDTASPDEPLTLAKLLDPATRARIESLQVDYLVVSSEPEAEELGQWGGSLSPPLPVILGAEKNKGATTVWAAVIDVRQRRLVEQLTTRAVGTDVAVGYVYALAVLSLTEASAKQGVVRHVVRSIAQGTPTGPVKVVFLAQEIVPTSREIAAAKEEIVGHGVCWPSPAARHPTFRDVVPPMSAQALVYIYRPFDCDASKNLYGIDVYVGSPPAVNVFVTSTQPGGYFPLYVPPGELRLRVKAVSEKEPRLMTLHVAPAQTYYVKVTMENDWLFGGITIGTARTPVPTMTVVSAEEGTSALGHCVRLRSGEDADDETRRLAEQGWPSQQVKLARLYMEGVNYPNGRTLQKDDVEAYAWLTIAAGHKQWRSAAGDLRNELVADMTAEQIAEGERRARAWTDSYKQRKK